MTLARHDIEAEYKLTVRFEGEQEEHTFLCIIYKHGQKHEVGTIGLMPRQVREHIKGVLADMSDGVDLFAEEQE